MMKAQWVWMCECGANARTPNKEKAEQELARHWKMPTHMGKLKGTVKKV